MSEIRPSLSDNTINMGLSMSFHKRHASLSSKTSGYLDLVQRLEFGVDHLQKNAVYQIE